MCLTQLRWWCGDLYPSSDEFSTFIAAVQARFGKHFPLPYNNKARPIAKAIKSSLHKARRMDWEVSRECDDETVLTPDTPPCAEQVRVHHSSHHLSYVCHQCCAQEMKQAFSGPPSCLAVVSQSATVCSQVAEDTAARERLAAALNGVAETASTFMHAPAAGSRQPHEHITPAELAAARQLSDSDRPGISDGSGTETQFEQDQDEEIDSLFEDHSEPVPKPSLSQVASAQGDNVMARLLEHGALRPTNRANFQERAAPFYPCTHMAVLSACSCVLAPI